jgi:hypothetical protein
MCDSLSADVPFDKLRACRRLELVEGASATAP